MQQWVCPTRLTPLKSTFHLSLGANEYSIIVQFLAFLLFAHAASDIARHDDQGSMLADDSSGDPDDPSCWTDGSTERPDDSFARPYEASSSHDEASGIAPTRQTGTDESSVNQTTRHGGPTPHPAGPKPRLVPRTSQQIGRA